ncbi:MAG: tetratricopeptide repeat protein [Candidatus Methylacidiphilaceae bacterium]
MVAVSDAGKRWIFETIVLFSFLVFLILVASSSAPALDLAPLAKNVQRSVLLILEKDPSGKIVASGSGFLVSADGRLVTNDHGRKNAEELSAQAADGRIYRVLRILARDPRHDREPLQLAAGHLPFLHLSSPVAVRQGEAVAIIPSRFVGGNGVSLGTASVEPSLLGQVRLVVMTAALPRLYPGAPVIGSEGQVLGVATAKASRARSGQLAISVAAIGRLTILPEVPEHGVVAARRPEAGEPREPPTGEVGRSPKPPGAGEAAQKPLSSSQGKMGGEEEAAWALLRQRSYAKAAEAFAQALRRKSSDARTWLGFGLAKSGIGQLEEASTIFRQAVRLSPSNGQAWRELGTVDLQLKRYEEAADSFKHALQLRPRDARAWLGVAAADAALGKRPEALAALERVRDLAPKDGTIWRGVGKVYSRLGRREEEAMAFQRAVDCNPKDARSWLALGLVSLELGRTERAQEILPKLLALNPGMGMELVEALQRR